MKQRRRGQRVAEIVDRGIDPACGDGIDQRRDVGGEAVRERLAVDRGDGVGTAMAAVIEGVDVVARRQRAQQRQIATGGKSVAVTDEDGRSRAPPAAQSVETQARIPGAAHQKRFGVRGRDRREAG